MAPYNTRANSEKTKNYKEKPRHELSNSEISLLNHSANKKHVDLKSASNSDIKAETSMHSNNSVSLSQLNELEQVKHQLIKMSKPTNQSTSRKTKINRNTEERIQSVIKDLEGRILNVINNQGREYNKEMNLLVEQVDDFEIRMQTIATKPTDIIVNQALLIASKMDHEQKINNLVQNETTLTQRPINHTVNPGQKLNWTKTLNIPKFSNSNSEKPMQYLRDFKRYLDATNTHHHFTYLIHSSLSDTPLQWWQLVEEDTDTFETFKAKFTKRF